MQPRQAHKITLISIFTLGILGITEPVLASYFGCSNWYDVDKTWSRQDENMRWAAAGAAETEIWV